MEQLYEIEDNSLQQFEEPQQLLNSNNGQIFMNESEICVNREYLRNVEDVQEEHHTATDVQEERVNTEQFDSIQHELYDRQVFKIREHDVASLSHHLRVNTEVLALAKAKEEVTSCILQNQLQDEQENQGALEHELSTLNGIKEELIEKLNFEMFGRTQLVKEMSTTGEMKRILEQHYETGEKSYQSMFKKVKELEDEYKKKLDNYHVKKQQICAAIENENKNWEEIDACSQNDCMQYETEVDEKMRVVKELNYAYNDLNNTIICMTTKCEDLKIQVHKNKDILEKLLSHNDDLHKLITNINLEEVQGEKVQMEAKCQEALDTLKNKLDHAKQSFNSTIQQEIDLQTFLINETNTTNELDTALSKSEDDFEQLSGSRRSLECSIEEINTHSATVCSELTLNLQEIDNLLSEIKEKLRVAACSKSEKTNELHLIEQNNEEAQTKLKDLKVVQETLKNEVDLSTTKVTQLQLQKDDIECNIKKLTACLNDAKEIYFQLRDTYGKELTELDGQFSSAQIQLHKLKCEYENNTRKLKDELSSYKCETEKADQENQQNAQKKLQKLEELLAKARHTLEQAEENNRSVVALIDKKKNIRDNLELDRQKLLASSTTDQREYNSSQKSVGDLTVNSMPISILKSPGKSISPSKKVSFQQTAEVWSVSSNSSVGTNVEANMDFQSSKPYEDKRDTLLRMSPPQRLQERKTIKRSRLD